MPNKNKKNVIVTRELIEEEQKIYDKLEKVINNNFQSYYLCKYMIGLVDELVEAILKNDGQVLEVSNGR